MGTVNRALLVGRLGRAPELRYTPEGQAVTRFSLATDRPARADAERVTDWHQVVCFGKAAEFAGQYLDRGHLVCVVGRITYRSWEGRAGQTRRTTEIVAADVVALDRKPDAADDEPPAPGSDETRG